MAVVSLPNTLNVSESDGFVSVCITLDGPSGGIERDDLQFTLLSMDVTATGYLSILIY